MDIFERKNARVQISISPELLKEVDEFAKDNYCTRSGVFCLAVSQFMTAQRMGKAMKQLYKLVDTIASERGTPEDLEQLDRIHDALKLLRPDL